MASTKEDLKSIQADVASFASSLGFATAGDSLPGFNDADFRKKGRIGSDKKHRDSSKKETAKDDKTDRNLEFVGKKKNIPKFSKETNNSNFKQNGANQKVPHKPEKLTNRAQKSVGKIKDFGDRNGFGENRKPDTTSSAAVQNSANGAESNKEASKILSLLKSGPWFEVAASLLDVIQVNQTARVQGEELDALVTRARIKGENIMEKVVSEYEKTRGKDSDMKWLMVARKTGTTADKVAAFTVLLQDNPAANIKSLDALVGMVTSKGGKRHSAVGIDALKELFLTSLLPDRKLKYLSQQPLATHPNARDADQLVFLWYWEDCLKQRYHQFITSLEEASKDKLPFLKEKAVKTLYELLKGKPEQERKLLCALVNKLGDPERKVASNAGYYLSCLLTTHPNMKMVVVEEVDSFLFRPHMVLRARYQAIVFLNQILLSNRGDGPKLARRLIDVYFSVFKIITTESRDHKDENKIKEKKKKKNKDHEQELEDDVVEIDSRLLSALLTGVNRAFPYVAAEEVNSLIEEHTPILFRLAHSKSFNVGVQALTLLYQLLSRNSTTSDRFYRALYAVLLSPGLPKSTKVEMFLSLVYKAIKSDISTKRMAAFSKRLLQVALQGAPQFACGCLLLLSEVLKLRPTLWHTVTQPEDEDDEIEHFKDVPEDETELDADQKDTPCSDSPTQSSTWPKDGRYNMRHRDPSFCNADRACWWELSALAAHSHPSVAVMANNLLSGATIFYTGDPVKDLALGVFLDRFAEKKPKSRRNPEPTHNTSCFARARKATPADVLRIGDEFLQLAENEVAPEDVPFHKFYTTKLNRKTKKLKGEKMEEDTIANIGGDDTVDDDNSDDDEIDELLEQDEGLEMGMDDISGDENDENDEHDDNDSEGEWVFKEPDGTGFNQGQESDSDEDIDIEDMKEYDSDEDATIEDMIDEHNTFEMSEEDNNGDDDDTKTSKMEKKKTLKKTKEEKKSKKLKKEVLLSEGGKKSPFASFEEYSHLLGDENVDKKASKDSKVKKRQKPLRDSKTKKNKRLKS